MPVTRLWRTTATALVLAASTAWAVDPPAETPIPGRLSEAAVAAAKPLPPAPGPIVDSNLQTINWLARPKAAPAAPPTAETPTGDILPATTQEPLAAPQPLAETQRAATAPDLFNYEVFPGTVIQFDGLMRGFWRNDQRIYWSGLENTFGAEGVVRPLIQSTKGNWTVSGQAEFFLNMKYGNSILSDPQRDLYRANFQIDPFEIFQIFGQVQYGDWIFRLGKTRTPFGGYYSPSYTNSQLDAPFVRTEVISWTETGMFLHYEPGLFSGDVGFVNGEPNLDTNSSKGVIARVGLNREYGTIGASVKWQDGVSSEIQKRFNNIVGLDYSLRYGRFILYGEATYDQYGFHRDFEAFGNPLNLGSRSLYHRDVFTGADHDPAQGVGYYVALGYRGDRWLLDGSFGTYYPEQLGIPAHDVPINRGVLKAAYSITPNFQVYAVGLIENVRPPDGVLPNNNPFALWFGMQLAF